MNAAVTRTTASVQKSVCCIICFGGRLKRLVLTEQARAMDEYMTERMKQMEQLLRQGITEDELKGWFAVCEKIRSNLEQYQCNMCREGQK